MLLYFGSRGIMHQGNTCLCDVHHSRPNLWDLPEPAFALSQTARGYRQDKVQGKQARPMVQGQAGSIGPHRIPFRNG